MARLASALYDRLPAWIQARCGTDPRALWALLAALAVVVALAVHHFWAARPEVVRAPAAQRPATSAARSAGLTSAVRSAGPGPAAGAGGSAGAQVVVDIAGRVRSPGVRRLPAGSRVADALRAAGGLRPNADTDALNRARLLVDGEQILVGPRSGTAGPAAAAPAVPGTGTGTGTEPGAVVRLNTATVEQLDTLPGVGPVLAQHILDFRTRHGGFTAVDQLREVDGIGDRRFHDLRTRVQP